MTVDRLDPDADRDVDAWVALWQAITEHDLPDDLPPGRTELSWWLRASPTHAVTTLVVRDDTGELAGAVRLGLPTGENSHMSWSNLYVRPDRRRRGIGRQLFEAAIAELRSQGRRTVSFDAPDSTAGQAFAAAVGAVETVHKVRYLYRFDRVDPATRDAIAVSAAEPSPGYALVRWIGPCPPEHLDAFVNAITGMLDAPLVDALDYVPTKPVAAEIRDDAVQIAELGIREYVICARSNSTGAFAGMTRVYVFSGGRGDQDDTTVLAAHRGHGLGLRMKSEMVRWLAETEPDLVQIETWNDATNDPMIRVNVALGCTRAEVWPTWTTGVPA